MSAGIPAAIRSALVAYASQLRAVFGARLHDVKLFGAWARGDAPQHADVEVLVLVDRLADQEAAAAEREVAALRIEHHLAITPMVMSTEQFEAQLLQDAPLALEIESEGISV
jgi:predicted nucleotidyltransferase